MRQEDLENMYYIIAGIGALNLVVFWIMAYNVGKMRKHMDSQEERWKESN